MRLPIKRTICDPLGIDHAVERLPWWTLWCPNPHHKRDPRGFIWTVGHALFGRRWGCSCSKCFTHPKRRIPPREIYRDRVRLAELEQRVGALARRIDNQVPHLQRLAQRGEQQRRGVRDVP